MYQPPLALQEQFATRINKLEQLKANHIAALTQQTELFASLQHQAFTGNL
jgi:type I restriction enzyme S subunit